MKTSLHMSLLLLVAIMLLTTQSALAGWGSKELETEKIAVKFAREIERGSYQIVSTDELHNLIDQGNNMLIIDTMPYEASYLKQHIPGAVQFELPIPELTEMDGETKARFETLLGADKNRQLVFYCGFTKCSRSHNGAMWAVKLGYTNVYRCPGGIKAWTEADFPVEKGK